MVVKCLSIIPDRLSAILIGMDVLSNLTEHFPARLQNFVLVCSVKIED